jgi:hypothetical protein
MMFCQNCGERVQENAQSCSRCGTPRHKPAGIAAVSSTGKVPNNEGNAIWNPNAASNWSVIFTPAFGSYLHALNWRTLGEQDRASSSMNWFYLSLVMFVVYLCIAMFVADEKAAEHAARGLSVLYLTIWYISAGRSQAKYVRARFGKDYPRRGWGKPLVIGVAAIIGYFIVAAGIGFTTRMMVA